MAERLFSPEDRAKLFQNNIVLKVGEVKITYSPAFKAEAVRANLVEGKTPQFIFVDAGFDLDVIGRETPKRRLKKWRVIFKQRGEQGLRNEQRGKNGTGRPSEREMTVEAKLRRAEAQVRYLKQENECLKKLDGLERAWLANHRKSTLPYRAFRTDIIYLYDGNGQRIASLTTPTRTTPNSLPTRAWGNPCPGRVTV